MANSSMENIEIISSDKTAKCLWFNPFQLPENEHDGKLVTSIEYSITVLIRMWDENENKIGYFTGWFRYDLNKWIIRNINNPQKIISIPISGLDKLRDECEADLFEWTFMPQSAKELYTNSNVLFHLN